VTLRARADASAVAVFERDLRPIEDIEDRHVVALWHADLDRLAPRLDSLRGCLSDLERLRADRFRFEHDRRRFATCRVLLRWLLARELDGDPSAIEFSYGPFGKPALDTTVSPPLMFNVSHSEGQALIAVTRGAQVGVDIERMRCLDDVEQLASSVFSATERRAFDTLSPGDRMRGFFNGWTRKEAYIKARGDGLQRALESFDVTLIPGEPARLTRVENEPVELDRWTLSSFEPAPGYAAALCVERCSTH
jgi:4'-phosphopantetheinyl transferase